MITLQEWQGWGTASPFPAMVAEIVEELRGLERDMDGQMSFGGLGGKIKVMCLTQFLCGALGVYVCLYIYL